jgi:hypothetical protein
MMFRQKRLKHGKDGGNGMAWHVEMLHVKPAVFIIRIQLTN